MQGMADEENSSVIYGPSEVKGWPMGIDEQGSKDASLDLCGGRGGRADIGNAAL